MQQDLRYCILWEFSECHYCIDRAVYHRHVNELDRILEILDLININADSPNLIKSFTPITPIPNLSQSASCCSIFVYFRPVILAIINRFKDQTKHEDVQVLISTRSPQSRLECLDTKAQWDAGKKTWISFTSGPANSCVVTNVCVALHSVAPENLVRKSWFWIAFAALCCSSLDSLATCQRSTTDRRERH